MEDRKIVGNARNEFETKAGKKVVSPDKYFNITGQKETKKLK